MLSRLGWPSERRWSQAVWIADYCCPAVRGKDHRRSHAFVRDRASPVPSAHDGRCFSLREVPYASEATNRSERSVLCGSHPGSYSPWNCAVPWPSNSAPETRTSIPRRPRRSHKREEWIGHAYHLVDSDCTRTERFDSIGVHALSSSAGMKSKVVNQSESRRIMSRRERMGSGLKILALSRDADTQSPVRSCRRPPSPTEVPEYPTDTHAVFTLQGPCRHLARRLVCQLGSQSLSKRSWVQDPPRSRLVASPRHHQVPSRWVRPWRLPSQGRPVIACALQPEFAFSGTPRHHPLTHPAISKTGRSRARRETEDVWLGSTRPSKRRALGQPTRD